MAHAIRLPLHISAEAKLLLLRCRLGGQSPWDDPDHRRVGEDDPALRASTNLTAALLLRQLRDLAALAEQTPPAPAGLNQRVLRAVIADQQQIHNKADRQQAAGLITLTTLRAVLIILAVTVATFSAGVWAASNLGN
jgi:hypothetical protein